MSAISQPRARFSRKNLKYDSFGQVTSESNSAVDHLFAFIGRERDEETALQYHRRRYYDPVTGTWLSETPNRLEDVETNPKTYAHNSPTNRIHPTGATAIGTADTGSPFTVAQVFGGDPDPIEEEIHDDGSVTITINEPWTIVLLFGHGGDNTAAPPHTFNFGNPHHTGTAAAFVGCNSGLTNEKIPQHRRLVVAKMDNEPVYGRGRRGTDETSVQYWMKIYVEDAIRVAKKLLKDRWALTDKVTIRIELAGKPDLFNQSYYPSEIVVKRKKGWTVIGFDGQSATWGRVTDEDIIVEGGISE